MENPEEILHSLEEYAKFKPKDIPRELEEYLCFVAKTGDPVYQWSIIKSLFREKLISVITEFYESCPSVEIPPCPNVDLFNYDTMKTFILEKLDTFVAAPFTVQRICELLTTPRKEYNRIDKYMRALEKNILVVSTTEPGHNRTAENENGFINGLESEHMQDGNNSNDINIEEMDDTPVWTTKDESEMDESNAWSRKEQESESFQSTSKNGIIMDTFPNPAESNTEVQACSSSVAPPPTETVITCCPTEEHPYVSIEAVTSESVRQENETQTETSVTITAIPAAVQKRRDSIEPPTEVIVETVEVVPHIDDKIKTDEIVEPKDKIEEPAVAECFPPQLEVDKAETESALPQCSEPSAPEESATIEPPAQIPIIVEAVEVEKIAEEPPTIEASLPTDIAPIVAPIAEIKVVEVIVEPIEEPIVIAPIIEVEVASVATDMEKCGDTIAEVAEVIVEDEVINEIITDEIKEDVIEEIVAPIIEEVIIAPIIEAAEICDDVKEIPIELELESEPPIVIESPKIDEDITEKILDNVEIETKIEQPQIVSIEQPVEINNPTEIVEEMTETVATTTTPEIPVISVPEIIQVPTNPETPMDVDETELITADTLIVQTD